VIQLAGSFNAGYKQPIVGQQIGQESVCMQLRAKKERERAGELVGCGGCGCGCGGHGCWKRR